MASVSTPVPQLDATDLHQLYAARRYAEIVRLHEAGAFNELLGAEPPTVITGQWTQADLDAAHAQHEYKKIVTAREAGQLDDLLGVEVEE